MVLLISSWEYMGSWLTEVVLVWIALEKPFGPNPSCSLIDTDLPVHISDVVPVGCPPQKPTSAIRTIATALSEMTSGPSRRLRFGGFVAGLRLRPAPLVAGWAFLQVLSCRDQAGNPPESRYRGVGRDCAIPLLPRLPRASPCSEFLPEPVQDPRRGQQQHVTLSGAPASSARSTSRVTVPVGSPRREQLLQLPGFEHTGQSIAAQQEAVARLRALRGQVPR